MKHLNITAPANFHQESIITLPLSKSIANRMLIIGYMTSFENSISIPECDDSVILLNLLRRLRQDKNEEQTISLSEYNAGEAGTVFRFLAALLAIIPGKRILTGSSRMLERPCRPLVEALKMLGAECSYLGREGYPPLLINGKKLQGGKVTIDSSISSQFITGLMLIAPMFPLGLTIELKGSKVSMPYIELTAQLMRLCGISISFDTNIISVYPGNYLSGVNYYEGDWSAASYWYVAMALIQSQQCIILKGLNKESSQGDKRVSEIFTNFGVSSEWHNRNLYLRNNGNVCKSIKIDLTENPDLAPSVAIVCAGLGINSTLTGLQTLAIKESNRLDALSNELSKLGYDCSVNNQSSLIISGRKRQLLNNSIDTYHDHRIAMAMSLLSLKHGSLVLNDPSVVSKSYPSFWKDLESVGFIFTR